MAKPHISAASEILGLLWPEFTVIKGCVFLKGVVSTTVDTRFPSETEWAENHIHILDYFTHGAELRREPFFNSRHSDFKAAGVLGRQMCFMWAHKLRQDFPRWHFRVYFHGFDPIVRFHKVRKGEEPVVREKHWKKEIASGARVIVDTRKLRS